VIIIIDANNYIKSISSVRTIDDRVIQSWILTFQNYMKLRGNKVILVFDAGPSFYQSQQNHAGVLVVHAGHSQTADDVIKIWLERNVGQDILLVTSDRQIRDYALNLAVISISSQDFYKIFNQVVCQEEVIEKRFADTVHKMEKNGEPANPDLDEIMEQASRNLVAGKVETGYDENVRVSSSSKIKKADRQVHKKIDKI
jgi:predicted RNA-binding protein with PIN domain